MDIKTTLRIAMNAHEGQLDKAGFPYITHPIRVALNCDTEEQKIVALLHDVVEDTPMTLHDLKDLGYSQDVVDAVDALTQREGETYEDFVLRARCNPIARVVKINDIKDNMDLTRIPNPRKRDFVRNEKYAKALAVLS